MNNLTEGMRKLPEVKAIIMLRHPISRFVSFARFFYNLSFGSAKIKPHDAALVREFTTQGANSTTVLRVLELVRGRFPGNKSFVQVDQYSRIFNKNGSLNEPGGITPRLSLSNFVVGITERMKDTKLLVAVELGLPADDICEPVEVMRENGGKKKPLLFDKDTTITLLEALSNEVGIYNLALNIHEGQLQGLQPKINEMHAALKANEASCTARRDKAVIEIEPLLRNAKVKDRDIVKACGSIRAAKHPS